MNDHDWRWFFAGLSVSTLIGSNILTAIAASDQNKSWKKYIPSAIVSLVSIGSILSGNVMANGMEAAFMMAAGAYAQNRERLYDVFDKKKARTPRPKIKKDELLWFDATRGEDGAYFGVVLEDFIVAMYELELWLQEEESVSYGDFYRLLGVTVPPLADLKGWSIGAGVVYGYKTIRFEIDRVTLDDGLECNVFRFVHPPTYDYLDYTPDEDYWDNREMIK